MNIPYRSRRIQKSLVSTAMGHGGISSAQEHQLPVAQGDEIPGSYPSSFVVVDSNLGDNPFRNMPVDIKSFTYG